MVKRSSEETSPPSSLPESTPPHHIGDHSDFILSNVIDIQHSLGRVEQAIADLTRQYSEQSIKIDDISKTVHTGKGILIVAGVVLGALGGTIVFFLNKLWNVASILIQAKPHP